LSDQPPQRWQRLTCGRLSCAGGARGRRASRHYQSMDQADSDEWRAFRNRRKPADEEWAAARSVFASGAAVTGVVPSHHPFGFFVDLGNLALGLAGISHVKGSGQAVTPEDYPAAGREITAVVLIAVDLQRQVHLSTRPSDLKTATLTWPCIERPCRGRSSRGCHGSWASGNGSSLHRHQASSPSTCRAGGGCWFVSGTCDKFPDLG
jgi:hypothetical protein